MIFHGYPGGARVESTTPEEGNTVIRGSTKQLIPEQLNS